MYKLSYNENKKESKGRNYYEKNISVGHIDMSIMHHEA